MNPDLLLVLGLIVITLSIPAILSALSDRRAPRAPIMTILIGGAMILYAATTKPGGSRLEDLPEVVTECIRSQLPPGVWDTLWEGRPPTPDEQDLIDGCEASGGNMG